MSMKIDYFYFLFCDVSEPDPINRGDHRCCLIHTTIISTINKSESRYCVLCEMHTCHLSLYNERGDLLLEKAQKKTNNNIIVARTCLS